VSKFYTEDMYRDIRKIKKPYPFHVDIVEHSEGLALRIYEDDIMRFNDGQRYEIVNYLGEVLKSIETYGIPCHIQGAKGGVPGRVRP